MDQLPKGLLPFAEYHQFIIHQNKVPTNTATMKPHSAHDPDIWMDAQTAIDTAKALDDSLGVGFVFTKADPFWFLDIDDCMTPTGMTPLAEQMVEMFSMCPAEVSQSYTGLHLFGTGDCPPHGTRNEEHGMEFYTEKRFVALTGNMLNDEPADADCSLFLPWLVETFFSYTPGAAPADWTIKPVPEWKGITDDDLLIQKFRANVSVTKAMDGGWLNEALFTGKLEEGYDASAADMSLASRLAFWTGKDCQRIERIMKLSGLKRDKWSRRENPPGYLRTTILKACANCTAVYNVEPGPPPPPPPGDLDAKTGYQYMSPPQQTEYFKDHVYVMNTHTVWVPGLDHLKPDQYKSQFGGYDFAIDDTGGKKTDNAWKAFTESQAVKFPKVYGSAFRPKERSGKIIVEEGRQYINTYEPYDTPRIDGDTTPWMNWLKLVLPEEQDRVILLSFMAAIVQNPGVKFPYTILIQGMQGNGKGLITKLMEFCVGRRYTHIAKASDLGGNGFKFNGWMLNKLLIIFDEIYTAERHHMVEDMKPFITEDRAEIQMKGRDQVMADTPFAILMATNHKDAIRTTFDHRRICTMYMAQQSIQDLRSARMVGDFFPYLWNWCKKEGFAIMNNYLHEYRIPDEYNPATLCQRAPTTSSTNEAVNLSLGAIEQEIMDAIDEGRPGFAGFWVSSIMLNRLFEKLRVTGKIPQNKRREMMNSIGYEWHPALSGGRVNNPIPQEGGKPKLFAQIGHPVNSIGSAADVTKAYCKAQGYAPQFDGIVKKN